MQNENIMKLLNESLNVYKEIQEIKKGRLQQLEKLLKSYSENVKDEMGKSGIKTLEGRSGYAKWVDRKGTSKLNELEIAKRLEVENLDQFRVEGKPTSYIKFNINK